MKNKIRCPYCSSMHIQKDRTDLGIKGYFCCHCGSSFIKGEPPLNKALKKISRDEFFQIIYDALEQVLELDDLSLESKQYIQNKFFKVEVYYEEIANLYAEALYELDCDQKEEELNKTIFKKNIIN